MRGGCRTEALGEEGDEPLPEVVLRFEFTLVDCQHRPAHGGQFIADADVPSAIAGDLGRPIVAVGLRQACASPASVAMPEAAVDEDRLATRDECEVGCAGKVLPVEPVAETKLCQELAEEYLGRSVARANTRHDLGAIEGHKFKSDLRSRQCRDRARLARPHRALRLSFHPQALRSAHWRGTPCDRPASPVLS